MTNYIKTPSKGGGREGVFFGLKIMDYHIVMILCSICLNKPTNKLILGCKHVFCKDCILKWSEICLKNNVLAYCPNCRSALYFEKENNDQNDNQHLVQIDLFILFVFIFGFLNIVNKPIYQFWLLFIILFFAIILLDKLMVYNYS